MKDSFKVAFGIMVNNHRLRPDGRFAFGQLLRSLPTRHGLRRLESDLLMCRKNRTQYGGQTAAKPLTVRCLYYVGHCGGWGSSLGSSLKWCGYPHPGGIARKSDSGHGFGCKIGTSIFCWEWARVLSAEKGCNSTAVLARRLTPLDLHTWCTCPTPIFILTCTHELVDLHTWFQPTK